MSEHAVWFDSHCHLGGGDSVADLVAEAIASGVGGMITVGTDPSSSQEAVSIAVRQPHVWSTVGVHPHDASAGGVEQIAALTGHAGVVAVGECGLDYHYLHSPVAAQRTVFAQQIQLARQCGLPLVIHTREAWDDTFEILESEGAPVVTIFHCFTGGVSEARRALDLGAYLSFSGIVTFASADEVREAAVFCPVDRLLVETDSPYLAPVPHRGRPNRPALVKVVGEAVAGLRGDEPAVLASRTTANARTAFGLS